jgi:hypothetical protein
MVLTDCGPISGSTYIVSGELRFLSTNRRVDEPYQLCVRSLSVARSSCMRCPPSRCVQALSISLMIRVPTATTSHPRSVRRTRWGRPSRGSGTRSTYPRSSREATSAACSSALLRPQARSVLSRALIPGPWGGPRGVGEPWRLPAGVGVPRLVVALAGCHHNGQNNPPCRQPLCQRYRLPAEKWGRIKKGDYPAGDGGQIRVS